MGNQVDRTFTWVIKNFSTLRSEKIYSDEFVISGCKWRLLAYPEGDNSPNNFSLYLEVADYESLPSGCRRHVHISFTLVSQFHENLSLVKATRSWLDHEVPDWGFTSMIALTKLHDNYCGFLVNNELKIVVEVDVLQVIGKLDVPEESEEATKPPRKMKHNDDDADIPEDLVDVNGFQVLPSQVGLARRIFEKHPETALECRTKNQSLRTSYMNVLLSLIKMLFKGPEEQSKDDLSDAEAALVYMTSVGFKLDWLEKKLDEVKESKKKCVQVCEMEQQLHDLEQKSKDLKAQLDKYNAEILEATASDLFLSDVV
ncbi:PREDICTED: MATH domain and coiled-coil domain-containing protein At3g58270-like [Camelina sativa]|uniref:MATH domain and coiled-coil domain-containing protein At3g58270-like n=1 Tax=Camelina sativa TaxID=90675 RepID=A0ABM0TU34_CAMSA|nr:PREDICTED: MATH domain and coiled-coil domain-containing protein At3g58270-like [Camelina sativa]